MFKSQSLSQMKSPSWHALTQPSSFTTRTSILMVLERFTSGEKLGKLIDAAGVKIDAFWPKLFAKALNGRNVADFFGVGGGEAGEVADAAPAKEAAKDNKKDVKKEAKKEEPKKVEPPPPADDVDMGMGGLFD